MYSLKIFKLPEKISASDKKIEILANFQLPTIIGRGALLKCAEKKVSRTHASIDWDDDGIIITSTHTIPTYANVNGQLKIINKGEFSILKNGDQFGLLADSFWYEISLSRDSENNYKEIKAETIDSKALHKSIKEEGISNNILLEYSVGCDERNNIKDSDRFPDTFITTESKEQIILTEEYVPENFDAEQSKESTNLIDSKNDDATEGSINDISMKETEPETIAATSCRQRKLPTWLIVVETSKGNELPLNTVARKDKLEGNVKKSKIECSIQENESDIQNIEKQFVIDNAKRYLAVKKDFSKVSKKRHYVSQECDDYCDLINKNLKPLPDEDNDLNQDPSCFTDVHSKNNKCEKVVNYNLDLKKINPLNFDAVSDDDLTSGQSLTDADNTPSLDPLKVSLSANRNLDEVSDEDEPSDKEVKKQRQSCVFGSNCYRRNSSHKKEYAHHGDKDFVLPNATANDDDRPQCEHGVDCYRKNPQHRKTFQHLRIPQPRRRAARPKRKRDDDDDEHENEYDSEDPFLNDDSSDDYAPTDSDTDSPVDNDVVDEEDAKRMLKEAKKFTKIIKS